MDSELIRPGLSRHTQFLQDMKALQHFGHVCIAGLTAMGRVNHREVIWAKLRGEKLAFPQEDISELPEHLKGEPSELERFAMVEIHGGFQYVLQTIVFRLHSLMEAFAEDMLIEAIKLDPHLKTRERLMALKVNAAELIDLGRDELCELLAREIQQDVRKRGPGIDQFDAPYHALGLRSRGIEPEVSRAFVEFVAVRNLVAHRGAVIDAKFLKDCPWFPGQVWEPLQLTRENELSYQFACLWYSSELMVRWLALRGWTLPRREIKRQEVAQEALREYYQTGGGQEPKPSG